MIFSQVKKYLYVHMCYFHYSYPNTSVVFIVTQADANTQQAHNVETTSIQRWINVESTLF